MPQKCETPPVQGGATRDKLSGGSRFPSTLHAQRAQFLISAYAVRPDRAGLIASMAFGGPA